MRSVNCQSCKFGPSIALTTSMELLLNILWLLIVLAALGVWCMTWAYDKRRKPTELLQEWTALTCALVFLFFAVSLSDNLHAAATLCDDAATSRRHSLAWDSGNRSHQNAQRSQASCAAVLSRPLLSVNLQFAERIRLAAAHVDRDLKETSLFGRSPPPSSHS